jgi:hypothetical protein
VQAKRFILLFLSLFFTYCTSAQLAGELMQSRILILLDGSSSMTQKWVSGRVKYNSAQEVIMRIVDSVYAVNDKVQFGLRMFGHQHTVPEHDCYDTRMEVPFSEDNRSQMSLRLQDIQPVGITPIAFALKEAANKDIIDEEHYAYSIILITDGGESCGGDICDVMRNFLKSKVYFKPYIVSLENDPGLRTTYSCMGDYLQVTNDGEIPPAVKTIVDALRPAIKIKKTDYAVIQTIKKESGHKKDNLSHAGINSFILFPVAPREVRPKAVVHGVKAPAVKIDSDDIRKPVNIAGLTPARLKQLNIPVAVIRPKPVKGPVEMPEVKADTPRGSDNISKLRLASLRTFNVIFVMDEKALSYRRAPMLPPVKVDPNDLVVSKPEPQKREFKVEVTDDVQTTVEVYFTNGTGTFYTSTPQVLLIDPITKQTVKKFYRTVDAAGNPDPQQGVPPGLYELSLVEKRDLVLNGVRIQANKKNKILVKVTTASLSFAYKDSLGRVLTRPVKEFVAEVIERNKAHGRVQLQKGTERIQYEPGNYHVEINTLPLSIHNVDLLFDAESVIAIPQPGFVKLMDDGRTGTAMLWYRRGDRFEKLRPVNPAETRARPLQLQPGEYQVHYQKGPSVKMKPFRIKETTETVVELD